MIEYNVNNIEASVMNLIIMLKATKVGFIRDATTQAELKRSLVHCGTIDVLLLPLYYALESIYGYDRELIPIENNLIASYGRFCSNVVLYTSEICYQMKKMPNALFPSETCTKKELVEIYELILSFINNKAYTKDSVD
jgi:hypothetical protein